MEKVPMEFSSMYEVSGVVKMGSKLLVSKRLVPRLVVPELIQFMATTEAVKIENESVRRKTE